MEWINIEDQKPNGYEMVILDTDKGIAVGCFDPFGELKNAIFGFVGVTTQSNVVVKRWMPLPKS